MQQNHDFEQAYAELSAVVYRYARYKLGSKEAAEDVTAETFVRLLENPKSQEASNLKAWTLAIARNIILNTYKQQKVLPLTTKGEETSLMEGPEQGQLTAELLRTLQGELQNLESETREIIILKTWEELKFDEIAEVMNLNVNNVKAKYYRGIEDLKMKLNTEDKDKKARSVALPVILLGIAQLSKANVLAPSPEFLGKLWEKIGAEFTNLHINYLDMSKNSIKQLLTRKLFIAAAIMTVALVAGIAGVTLLVVNNNSRSIVVAPEAQQPSDELPTEPVIVPEEPADDPYAGWVSQSFDMDLPSSFDSLTISGIMPPHSTATEVVCTGGGCGMEVVGDDFILSFGRGNDGQIFEMVEYELVGTNPYLGDVYRFVPKDSLNGGVIYTTNIFGEDICSQVTFDGLAAPCGGEFGGVSLTVNADQDLRITDEIVLSLNIVAK